MDPNYLWALWQLTGAYTEKGMFDRAFTTLEKALALSGRSPTTLASLGSAYAKSGRRTEAEKLLTELTELSKRSYVSPIHLASLQISLGNKDQAFEWLEKAYQERSNGMAYLNVWPGDNQPIRSDPRFHDLRRRVGLAP
jgi:tetratricopeptide (TPR) repeat protein